MNSAFYGTRVIVKVWLKNNFRFHRCLAHSVNLLQASILMKIMIILVVSCNQGWRTWGQGAIAPQPTFTITP